MSKDKPKKEVTLMPRMTPVLLQAKGLEVAKLIDQGTGVALNLAATIRDMLQSNLTDTPVFINAVMSAPVDGQHSEEETEQYLRRRGMVLRTTVQRASVAIFGEKGMLTILKKKEKGKLLGYEVGKPNPAKARARKVAGKGHTETEAEQAAVSIADGMTLDGLKSLIIQFCNGMALDTIRQTRQQLNDVFAKIEKDAVTKAK